MKKIVFISYYFYPDLEVAANRTRFWVEDLNRHFTQYTTTVITGTAFTPKEQLASEQFFIAPSKFHSLSLLIKDPGLKWKVPLIKFLKSGKLKDPYVFVITGGPFMHFSISEVIHNLFKSKVVLDFRDPFSNNPRFHNSTFKIALKRYFEKRFIKAADHIVSVNKECLNLLAGFKPNDNKFHVIPNGFDEETIRKVKSEMSLRKTHEEMWLIYPGKYYENILPNNTFKAIKELLDEGVAIKFIHYGKKLVASKTNSENHCIEENGIVDYEKVIKGLLEANIGVIFTEGGDFESSTKIFDYIGTELPILIITNGKLYHGNLHYLTMNYPLALWCKNETNEIKKTIRKFLDKELIIEYPEKLNFTRRSGLEKLLKIIES